MKAFPELLKQIAYIKHHRVLTTLKRDLPAHKYTLSEAISKSFCQSLEGGVYRPYMSVKVHSHTHRMLYLVRKGATPRAGGHG